MLDFDFKKRHIIEMKGIVISMKVDEMCNILKSVPATVFRNSHINVS